MVYRMDSLQDLLEGRIAVPLSPRAVWKFTGADRVRYLNGQVTHDVTQLRPGRALHAAVCNAKGKMEGDVWITATDDALWVDAPPELRETLGARLERYIIADDVTVEDLSDQVSGIHLLKEPATAARPPVHSTRFRLPGVDFWKLGPLDTSWPLAPGKLVETLRIQQGVPSWGREMTAQMLPPEAGLDRDAISYSKGCYIGQEVIARIKSKGHVNKKLARISSAAGDPPAALPSTVFHDGIETGFLTSACAHPDGAGWIGLGIVKRELAEAGGTVDISGHPATVSPL